MNVHVGFPSEKGIAASQIEIGVRPSPFMRPSQWLGENIELVDGEHAGELWSPDGAPYLAEIADCLTDRHPCNLVTVRKSIQTGVSILALAWCLYIADREPANTLYAAPSIDALRDLNSGKLQPLIDAWQRRIGHKVIVPQTSRSGSGSSTYEKVFSRGRLFLGNANAVMDLSSKTIKKGVKDELSKWNTLDNGSDPEKLFFGRFTAFRRTKSYKIFEISTPEVDLGGDVDGHCRIDKSFQRSDQRYWNCTCPECGRLFVHKFDRLKIDESRPHRTVYECFCGHLISEAERIVAVKGGRWIPSLEDDVARHPGFHVDAFISLMMSYEAIAEDWIGAQKSEIAKKDFSTTVLGLPHKYVGDAPDHIRLMALREDYHRRRIPPNGLILVAAADVQANAIYVEVVAFAPDRQSWVVEALVLDGDTSDPEQGAFAKLTTVYETEWPDSFGGRRRVDAMGVDSGFRANVVYTWTRGRPNTFALKGADGWSRPAISSPSLVDVDLGGKKIKQGAAVWTVGTWSLKALFYADLRKKRLAEGADAEPYGACHFGKFLDEPYFEQITAEYLAEEAFKGRTRKVWKERHANHFLDCRVYNLAIADYIGLTRMTLDEWKMLAKLRGVPEDLKSPDLLAPEPVKIAAASAPEPAPQRPPAQTPAPPRRASRSSYMG
jgi:phage terminase large subunit GpA-like protein